MLTGIKESQTLSQSSLLGESQHQAKAPHFQSKALLHAPFAEWIPHQL